MLCAAIAGTPAARAHATLEGSTPEWGAQLPGSPREIVLRFSEAVTPLSVRLLDAHLEDISPTPKPETDRTDIRLRVTSPLVRGRYLVSYRVISEDAHPVAGSFEFTVGVGTGATAPAIARATTINPWEGIQGPLRILDLLALVLTAGLALFVAIFGHGATKPTAAAALRLGKAAATLAVITILANFAVGAAAMVGGEWATVAQPTTWRVAAGSTLGRSAVLALLGILSVGFGLSKSGSRGTPRNALVVGALALAGSTAVTGHAAASSGSMMLAMSTHVLLAAFWVGALPPLWTSLRDGSGTTTHRLIDTFSRLAVLAVPVLVLLGAIMAWAHLHTIAALRDSKYGQLLVLKIIAVTILLLLAACNKFWLTPALVHDKGTSARRMQIVVAAEVLILAVVLGLSATLSQTAPGRVTPVESESGVHHGTITEGPYRVTWRLAPVASDSSIRRLTLSVERNGDVPVDASSATAFFALPDKALEPLTTKVAHVGPGQYAATVQGLTEPGRWRMGLEILVSDFDEQVFETVVNLP